MTLLGEQSPLLLDVDGVSHRFFGRVGGTSPQPWQGLNVSFSVGDAPARVEENLARTRFQLGVARQKLFMASQVHGANVVRVDETSDPDAVAHLEADAIFTTARDVAVGVRTADCTPILLAADDGTAVAAVHAGWRGAVGGVLEATIAALADVGVPAARLVAAVGPCIFQDAFEVGPEVIEQASRTHDLEGLVRAGRDDRQHLDLGGLCLRILENAGVTRRERVGGCTFAHPDRYFSHRYAKGGRAGRQLAAIARTTPPTLDAEMFG